MKYIIILMFSLNVYSLEILEVSSGETISSIKMNELITKINNLEASRTHYIGSVKWGIAVSSAWSNSSSNWAQFSPNSNAAIPIITGDITVPDKDLLAIKIPNAKKGKYLVHFNAPIYSNGTGQKALRISSGSDSTGLNINFRDDVYMNMCEGIINHNVDGDLNIYMESWADSPTSVILYNNSQSRSVEFTVTYISE